MGYLIAKAASADAETVRQILFREHNVELLMNTVWLGLIVVLGSIALGLPLAWLVTRTRVPGRRFMTLLCVLPLAVPGYVMAYALISLGGPFGAGRAMFDVTLPRASGLWGAALALTLYNFPYMFLTLRAAFQRMDPAQLEAARALGCGPVEAFRRVTLPSLLPALGAGSLLVGLYVLGDFGVVSLMRYETLSYALYINWTELRYAAWIALAMLSVAGLLTAAELYFAGRSGARVGVGAARAQRLMRPGLWSVPIWILVSGVLIVAVGVPVGTTCYWLVQGLEFFDAAELWSGAADSLKVAAPAALLTVALAAPVAWAAHRDRGRLARFAERSALVGYAVPSLALALGYVVVALAVAPGLRESIWLLIAAYVVHLAALAISPLRGPLGLTGPRHEEAARALGESAFGAFRRVALPALRGGLGAGTVLVFLAVMKELPLAKLLSPLDFRPLAVSAWGFADEALYADAAPYALSMVVVSTAAAALALRVGGES